MPSLGAGPSCCVPPPMAGQGPFWWQFGLLPCSLGFSLGSAGFILMLSVINRYPVLRLHLGVFGLAGLSSRCSESSILSFFGSSNLDLFLDTFWTHVRFLFVAKRISGAHLGALAGPH